MKQQSGDKEAGVNPEEHIDLVRQAQQGEKEAWEVLCNQGYPRWLREHHGKLNGALRGVWDTEDLIQSAIADAISGIKNLRNEAAFFAFVSTIIRRKLIQRGFASGRSKEVGLENPDLLEGNGDDHSAQIADLDETTHLLDAIISLFPTYPSQMGAVYLKYFEDMAITTLMSLFDTPERTTYRLIDEGRQLIRSRLSA